MEHDWSRGDRDGSGSGIMCLVCGTAQTSENRDGLCSGHRVRAIPPSIFNDLGSIGDTMGEIQAREGRAPPVIGDSQSLFAWYVNQVDPATSSGRMQDAIGRIYFLTRIAASPPKQN